MSFLWIVSSVKFQCVLRASLAKECNHVLYHLWLLSVAVWLLCPLGSPHVRRSSNMCTNKTGLQAQSPCTYTLVYSVQPVLRCVVNPRQQWHVIDLFLSVFVACRGEEQATSKSQSSCSKTVATDTWCTHTHTHTFPIPARTSIIIHIVVNNMYSCFLYMCVYIRQTKCIIACVCISVRFLFLWLYNESHFCILLLQYVCMYVCVYDTSIQVYTYVAWLTCSQRVYPGTSCCTCVQEGMGNDWSSLSV